MRRQVTVGGLVALALISGSVVAYAAQPAPPGECAPAVAAGAEGASPGLVPSPRVTRQDDPGPDDAGGDDPDSDDGGDSDGDQADDSDDGADDDSDDGSGDDGSGADSGDDDQADDSDDDPAGNSGDAPATDDPAAGEAPVDPAAAPVPGDPAGAAPADEPGTGAQPATDACAAPTASGALGWGEPDVVDEFDGPLGGAWRVYSGSGFDGQGTRTADALTVDDGVLTVTGDSTGATGGMAWATGQEYGRWEARVRTPVSDPSYNALLLLWPDDPTAAGSEIDFMEMLDPTRQTANAFVHHPGAEAGPAMGEVAVDGTAWHTWAVEWTPTAVTTYVDGVQWWSVDDPALLPSGPMHLCVQLDWFPAGEEGVRESSMQVDWVRQYTLDDAQAAPVDAAAPSQAGDPAASTDPDPASPDPAAGPDPVGPDPAAGGSADTPSTDRLSEGAPDAPARPGLVPGAVRTT